jgi:cytochrome c biogenesis protein CcmG, thiol:disulfide interchange protein DsbE
MKKKHTTWGKWINHFFTFILVAFVIQRLAHQFWQSQQREGLIFSSSQLIYLGNSPLPKVDQKKIILFWATWCLPCKVEMKRIKAEVLNGKIQSEQVWAISMNEEKSLVLKNIKKEKYPFIHFLDQGALAKRLNIQVTPTVLHVNSDDSIEFSSSGIGPLTIWRMRWFL